MSLISSTITSVTFGDGGSDASFEGSSEGSGTGDSGVGSDFSQPADSGGGGDSFTWDSWDGNEGSLPDTHKQAYKAINSRRESSAGDEIRRQLVDGLRSKFEEQKRASSPRRQAAGDNDSPITEADFERRLSERDRQRKLAERTDSFRRGMLDVVGKPQQYGDATVTFNSQEEVKGFEDFMREKFAGGISPREMLAIYRLENILKAQSDAAVRRSEKTLGTRKKGIQSGGRISQNANNNNNQKQEKASLGDGRRVPSLEDFVKSENPDAFSAITRGDLNVLENL